MKTYHNRSPALNTCGPPLQQSNAPIPSLCWTESCTTQTRRTGAPSTTRVTKGEANATVSVSVQKFSSSRCLPPVCVHWVLWFCTGTPWTEPTCQSVFSMERGATQLQSAKVCKPSAFACEYKCTCTLRVLVSQRVSPAEAVQCGLAPIPQFGRIVYNKRVRGSTTDYGTQGTYTCMPPYVLFGDAIAKCTRSGTWTKMPECRGRKTKKQIK